MSIDYQEERLRYFDAVQGKAHELLTAMDALTFDYQTQLVLTKKVEHWKTLKVKMRSIADQLSSIYDAIECRSSKKDPNELPDILKDTDNG